MNYDEMRAMERTHICAMCQGELVTIWDSEGNTHRLCCSVDHTHNGFQQRLSDTQMVRRGRGDKVIGPGGQKDIEERAKHSETALSLLPKADVATGQALAIDKIGALVLFADKIGLNAFLGHVCLYYGKPYRTIDGLYYQNNKRKKPYVIGTRPMNEVDKQAYSLGEGDYGYIAEAWLNKDKLQTVGIGIVTKTEVETKSPRHPNEFRAPVVHEKPQRMAEKRAEWQLLRKLIPLEVKE